MAAETIYQHPLDYELEVAAEQVQDVPFWIDLVQREQPRRVLEIGCGTGRLTLPLARVGVERGFSITGLDLEAAMLARAGERAQAESEGARRALRFIRADARSFSLAERFEVVLMPYGVAHHLLTSEDQLAAWRNARRHLAPDGLFAVDVQAPDLALLARARECTPRVVDRDLWGEDGRHLRRSVATCYDALSQRLLFAFEYEVTDPDETRRAYPSEFAMYVYFPQELARLFQETGFRVERFVGSYTGAPFDNHSAQLIALARPQ